MKRILVIEDDPDIATSLKYNLEKEGAFGVSVARDGATGLREASERPPDLVLLDLNLPGIDGLDVCRRLRADRSTASLPIIMITARIDESDKIAGLELGADDYVTKPFSVKEVVARVRALLRRTGRPADAAEQSVARGAIVLDRARRRVLVAGEEISLTRKEFDLLAALMESGERVLTRSYLLDRVWGYDHPGETRTVDVHVRKLRQKLGSPAEEHIETVVGVGYRFRERP